MLRSLMLMVVALMSLPSVASAWTYQATMDSYPSIGGGFSCVNRSAGYAESIADSTAPNPSRSLHGHMNEGSIDAKEPFHCAKTLPDGTKELYFQYYIKYGTNWQFHDVIDKNFYIYGYHPTEGRAVAGFVVTRQRSTGQVELVYCSASIFGQGYRYVNVGNAIGIEKNKWYKISGWIHAGTPGGYDGKIKLYVNDTLQLSYSNVPVLASYATHIAEASLTPVWGGNSGIYVPKGGMDHYFDNLIVSSEPLSGISGGDVTVKYPNAPAIIDVK